MSVHLTKPITAAQLLGEESSEDESLEDAEKRLEAMLERKAARLGDGG